MAEAVRVRLGDAGQAAMASEHNVHVVVTQGAAVDGLEEVAVSPATEVFYICSQRTKGDVAYCRPALLLSLALKDPDAVVGEEDVVYVDRDELAGADAGVEEEEDHRPHAAADVSERGPWLPGGG